MACTSLFDRGFALRWRGGPGFKGRTFKYQGSSSSSRSPKSHRVLPCCPAPWCHASSSMLEGSSRSSKAHSLQVLVVLIWQRHSGSLSHLLLVRIQSGLVDCNLRGCKSWSCDEFKGAVSDQFPGEPQEWLLEVVVGLSRDIVVL